MKFFLQVVILLFVMEQLLNAQNISTVTGTGVTGYNGDGIAANTAQLDVPYFVIVDTVGNLYIADQHNNRIRKITASTGIISTIAGTGVQGYNSDGIAATAAEINLPTSMAIDRAGNMYICDYYNFRIRRVDAVTGLISTVAGTGTAGYNGDNITATTAQLNYPYGVAVDTAGNVYIADTYNQRIREINISTGMINTIAGNGSTGFSGDGGPATSAQFNFPIGIDVDVAGNVYFTDQRNNRLREVTVSNGMINTIAGAGGPPGLGLGGYNGDDIPASASQLNSPYGVKVDAAGNIYIADVFNQRIRRIDAKSDTITTVAGNGTAGYNGDGIPATSAELDNAINAAVDACNLYIADANNNRVRQVSMSGGAVASITISASDTTICPGLMVTFMATPVNGGTAPSYQWKVNGSNAGTNSSSFSTSTLNNNDSVSCVMTSSANCVAFSSVSSNAIKITVTPGITASVTISASDTSICPGTQVNFTAIPVNGGSVPVYQWKVNSGSVGTDTSSFSTSTLNNNDTVTCVITSNAGCVTGSPAISNPVVISVGNTTQAGTIAAVRDTLCEGTRGNLTLSGNSSKTLQWQSSVTQGNFANINGIIDTTYYQTDPLSQTTYYRVVGGSGNCLDTTKSLELFVPPALTAYFNFISSGLTVTFNSDSSSGNIISYSWSFGDGTTSTDSNPSHTYPKTDTSYNVCLTIYDGSNCSYTFCKGVEIATGINEISARANWNIYPDPFSDYLFISGGELNKTIESIEICDMLGRIIWNMHPALTGKVNSLNLDVSALSEGMYFLKIKSQMNPSGTNGMDYVQKIIKQ